MKFAVQKFAVHFAHIALSSIAIAISGCGGGGGAEQVGTPNPPVVVTPPPVVTPPVVVTPPPSEPFTTPPSANTAQTGIQDVSLVGWGAVTGANSAVENVNSVMTNGVTDIPLNIQSLPDKGAAIVRLIGAPQELTLIRTEVGYSLRVDSTQISDAATLAYTLAAKTADAPAEQSISGAVKVVVPQVAASGTIPIAGGAVSAAGGLKISANSGELAAPLGVRIDNLVFPDGNSTVRLSFNRVIDQLADKFSIQFQDGTARLSPAPLSGKKYALSQTPAVTETRGPLVPFAPGLTGNRITIQYSYSTDVISNFLCAGQLRSAVTTRNGIELCIDYKSASSFLKPKVLSGGDAVLFVHGWTPSGFGGGVDTYKDFADLVPKELSRNGKNLDFYEFKWMTSQRFQDAAADLKVAIESMKAESPDRRIHIVAHSFGGLLARTLLQGKATGTNWAQPRQYVTSLLTYGTPHSGVFDAERSLQGITLPKGVDGFFGFGAKGCPQASCYQAGHGVISALATLLTPFNRAAIELYGLEKDNGEFIAKLSDWSNNAAPLPDNIPITIGVGLRRSGTVASAIIGVLENGDGLISFDGQRANPLLAGNKAALSCGAGIAELKKAVPLLAEVSISEGNSAPPTLVYPGFNPSPRFDFDIYPAFTHIGGLLGLAFGGGTGEVYMTCSDPTSCTHTGYKLFQKHLKGICPGSAAAMQAASVTDVACTNATKSETMTCAVDGKNLPLSDLVIALPTCDNIELKTGGTPTKQSFSCKPKQAGPAAYSLTYDGVKLFSGSVSIAAATSDIALTKVSCTSPVVGVPMTCTAEGSNLPASTSFTASNCTPSVMAAVAGGTGSQRQYTCTPNTAGSSVAVSYSVTGFTGSAPTVPTVVTATAPPPSATVASANCTSPVVGVSMVCTLKGTNLPTSAVFNATNCNPAKMVATAGGTSTQRLFSCTPVQAGLAVAVSYTVEGVGTSTATSAIAAAPVVPIIPSVTPQTPLQLARQPTVALGASHSLAIRADGTLWSWGYDDQGQLGLGYTGGGQPGSSYNVPQPAPTRVALDSVVSVAAGRQHSVAATSDGAVWVWGDGLYGQLGLGVNIKSKFLPSKIASLSDVKAVAAGGFTTYALRADGTVWVWGDGGTGQLGLGTLTSTAIPVQVPNLTSVVAISAGADHVLALRGDGSLWAWGYNASGQLGNGGSTTAFVAVQVTAPLGVASMSAGAAHSTAVLLDGTLWAWGGNSYGQLGNNTLSQNAVPAQVTGIKDVQSVAAGPTGTAALKIDGTVWTWGNNKFGQLGIDTVDTANTSGSKFPVQAQTPSGVVAVMAPAIGNAGRFAALRADGRLWVWGYNGFGELGDATWGADRYENPSRPRPMQLATDIYVLGGSSSGAVITTVVASSKPSTVAFGNSHSTAVSADGSLWSWGNNVNGQLGLGNTTNQAKPTRASLDSVVTLAAGVNHNLALTSAGEVWAWGDNRQLQLGFPGNTSVNFKPVKVVGLTAVTSIAAGNFTSYALRADGTVWVWGIGDFGELGLGATTDQVVPTKLTTLSNIIAIASGPYHVLALRADGTLWAWGSNGVGELGTGGIPNSTFAPVQVTGLRGVVSMSAGADHSAAVRSDGTVWTWGNNSLGQLGNNTLNRSAIPTQVIGLEDVQSVAAGASGTVALKIDGTVWTWGNNRFGQLGIGTYNSETVNTSGSKVPVEAQTPPSVIAVFAAPTSGGRFAALRADGRLWVWGYNGYGELGDGSGGSNGGLDSFRSTPVQLAGGLLILLK
jgi:alpha-tubulin suppressor-like RCC1 family protein